MSDGADPREYHQALGRMRKQPDPAPRERRMLAYRPCCRECPECDAKPGTPNLCADCVRRRDLCDKEHGKSDPPVTGEVVEDWVTQQFKDPKIAEYIQAALEACAGLSTEELEAMGSEGVKMLREALEGSVKLQSHYASLLNAYDGGERISFPNAEAWLSQLTETKKKESVRSASEELLAVAKEALEKLGKQGYGGTVLCQRLSNAIRAVEMRK